MKRRSFAERRFVFSLFPKISSELWSAVNFLPRNISRGFPLLPADVTQFAYRLYFYLDEVAGFDFAYALRRAGGDYVAFFERREAADVRNEARYREYHLLYRAVLDDSAVEARHDARGCGQLFREQHGGAERREGVEAFARVHCPSLFCSARAVTSFIIV